jgi:DNA-binding transcriptional LysR family regulator
VSDEQSYPDWELLASWVAVIDSGSVSDAARLLKISQAAVSQRVKQLENRFETPLLDRSTRPAQPTAAGQRLFEHAKELLTRADQMRESVRNVSRAKRMIVRFGCVDSFAATVGPLLIKALSSSSHQLRLWSGITSTMEGLIERRQLDLAVTTGNTIFAGISRAQLFTEPYYVVLPSTFEVHKLGSLHDVAQHLQFIRYSARSMIGQQIDEYLQGTGDALERTCEFDATDPLLSLVASGMGFALTTPICIWQSRHFIPKIRVLPLSAFTRHGRPYPGMTRTFHLAYRQGELGTLPTEVRDLVRIAIKRQISTEIGVALGLPKDILRTPADDAAPAAPAAGNS